MVLHAIFEWQHGKACQPEPDDEEGRLVLLLRPLLSFPKLLKLRPAGCAPNVCATVSAGYTALAMFKEVSKVASCTANIVEVRRWCREAFANNEELSSSR